MFKRSLLLGLVLSFQIGSAVAETRVAFVNVPKLLEDAPQVTAVRDSIKSEFARRDDELVAQQRQLKKLQDKLRKDGAIMSDAEIKRLEKDIVSRRRKLKNAQSEFQEDLGLRRNEKLVNLRKLIAEVVINVAKKQKIDIVLESGVVWASDEINITSKVLEELRAQ